MAALCAAGDGESWTGMKPPVLRSGAVGVVRCVDWSALSLDFLTQRRSMLALRLWVCAMAAVETPGLRQAATTWRLKSSL